MDQLEYGKPIRMFYANLLKVGLVLSVDSDTGRLHVDGNLDALSPVFKDEIIKRAGHLKELLTPLPPAELQPYFGRLLYLDEFKEGLWAAERIKAKVDSYPANGGWLLTMAKG